MSDTNGLLAALANAHNSLELYHAYGWPDRLGVRAALRVQIDALAAAQQPAPSAPEQPSAAVDAVQFNKHAIADKLTINAERRTSLENIEDVIAAIHARYGRLYIAPPEPLRVGAQLFSDATLRRMLDIVNERDAGRWEIGFRNIVSAVVGLHAAFEIADIVERVRVLATQPTSAAADRVPVELIEALRDIATRDPVEMVLDPQWAQRVACIALTAANIPATTPGGKKP